eukprot:TRINITY_DN2445_c0_g1_i3.p1 TRINITY_DN2445_c0_g1~~TRINITY_DN2445_c0_g1_i3.p1  ORF type:complete len:332 (-),score=72.83 TRINITY_DN2445_c0_g1_i3:173-1123(-)
MTTERRQVRPLSVEEYARQGQQATAAEVNRLQEFIRQHPTHAAKAVHLQGELTPYRRVEMCAEAAVLAAELAAVTLVLLAGRGGEAFAPGSAEARSLCDIGSALVTPPVAVGGGISLFLLWIAGMHIDSKTIQRSATLQQLLLRVLLSTALWFGLCLYISVGAVGFAVLSTSDCASVVSGASEWMASRAFGPFHFASTVSAVTGGPSGFLGAAVFLVAYAHALTGLFRGAFSHIIVGAVTAPLVLATLFMRKPSRNECASLTPHAGLPPSLGVAILAGLYVLRVVLVVWTLFSLPRGEQCHSGDVVLQDDGSRADD